MSNASESREWAQEMFGHADLGDSRRTRRLVQIAGDGAARPGGRVLQVCPNSATRQGAYDFLSNPRVAAEKIQAALTQATTRLCAEERFCFVSIDGTALTLTDWSRTKDFGAVGATNLGARGLKGINAYAISGHGMPLSVLGQQWWTREARKKRKDFQRRTVDQKETRYWLIAIEDAARQLQAVGVHAWFQIDREGDRFATLRTLYESGHWFTVRSTYGHRFLVGRQSSIRLRHAVAKTKIRGEYQVKVPGRFDRPGRIATMLVRTLRVTLDMVEPATGARLEMPINVVDARETGRLPRGATRVHWRLLTNRPVQTDDEVGAVLYGYQCRWKVEELHRTWKSGACRVEENQLRSANAVMKWAVIMIAIASRIERLKSLARKEPELPASSEFSRWEIHATRLLRSKYNPKAQKPSDEEPTLGTLVSWLADLGGYVGKSSGGPPGAITIRRGLDLVTPVAAALEQLDVESRMR